MKDYNKFNFNKFIKNKGYSCHYEGKWLVFDAGRYGDNINLSSDGLTALPDYIKFNNKGWTSLSFNKLKSLPDHLEFNCVYVNLSHNELTSLPNDIKFNVENIFLYDNPLQSLPDNIDEWYNKLDNKSIKELSEKFPDHWVFDKERFGL